MVPDAIENDQLLDVCLIKKMPIKYAISVIPMVIKGMHGSHMKVIMKKARKIGLMSKEPFIVHADGEILEDKAMEIKIELAKEKLSLITG